MRFRFVEKTKIPQLPKSSGVYVFLAHRSLGEGGKKNREFLYIGKASNLKERVKNHFYPVKYREAVILPKAKLFNRVKQIGYIKTNSEIEALILEANLIKKYQPKYNVIWRDDKNYFFVGITKEDFPRVFITHQPYNNGSRTSIIGSIIGPFVDGASLKQTLKVLRKVFPFRTCKTLPSRPCLWYQLGRCPAPCQIHPVKSSPSEVFAEGEQFNRVKKVIAVEKDPKLVEILGDTLRYFDNIKIIYGDILKIENWKLIENCKLEIGNSYKVVANLPFYLTAPVIRKFLESKNPPKEMTLIVQKEVGQRIVARPPDMNLLAISVQFYAKPEIVSYISKKSFWPQPKVDSAILRITQIHADTKTDSHRFFKIVRAGFSQPRKQLINNLSKGLGLERNKAEKWLLKNGIQPSQRAETLSIGDWINLLQSCRIK